MKKLIKKTTAFSKIQIIFLLLGILIITFNAFFSAQIKILTTTYIVYFLEIVSVVFILIGTGEKGHLKFAKKLPQYFIIWLFLLLFVAWGFLIGDMGTCFNILICLILVYCLMPSVKWISVLKKCIFIFSTIYVLFTFYFLIFPNQYTYMMNFYGYYPVGTYNLKTGYHAGIANHYSSNGIYISVCLMVIVCDYFSKKSSMKLSVKQIATILIVFIGLLLTNKRGVLIWSVLALIFTWLIINRNKIGSLFKIIVVLFVAVGVLQLIIEIVPQVGSVFERFKTIGEDYASRERLMMWALALQTFFKHPILGVGFTKFRDLYNFYIFKGGRYERLDAHNVYFQMLCETGIIGTALYIVALIILFFATIRLIKYFKHIKDENINFGLTFSLCIQIFYILYSLTGNCLYDFVFYFYVFAMAITSSLYVKMKRNELEKINDETTK